MAIPQEKRIVFLRLFSVLLFVFALLYFVLGAGSEEESDYTPAKPHTTRTIHVLFIGSSYIFVNNMPKMLSNIAQSDLDNTVAIDTDTATIGGTSLYRLWNIPKIKAAVNKQHWDYVVLEDVSLTAIYPSAVAESKQALGKWVDLITHAGATPVFLGTWPRQPGSSWYTNNEQARTLISPEFMQERENFYLDTVVKPYGIDIIRSGDYWMAALKKDPGLPLYGKDGSHPAPAGTYLSALSLYHYFTERPLDHVTYEPNNINPTTANTIRTITANELSHTHFNNCLPNCQ